MQERESAPVTRDGGLANDPRGRPGARQITVVAREAWQRACAELGAQLPWTLRRANLLVQGVALAGSAGSRLRVGDVLLEITGETEPCRRMDEQHAGLRAALEPEWRGGVSCRVLEGGTLAVGDRVALEAAER